LNRLSGRGSGGTRVGHWSGQSTGWVQLCGSVRVTLDDTVFYAKCNCKVYL